MEMNGDKHHTFQFSFEGPEVGLVHDHQTLLPVPSPRDHLTDLFRLFNVSESTYAIARDDVFENRDLGKNG